MPKIQGNYFIGWEAFENYQRCGFCPEITHTKFQLSSFNGFKGIDGKVSFHGFTASVDVPIIIFFFFK